VHELHGRRRVPEVRALSRVDEKFAGGSVDGGATVEVGLVLRGKTTPWAWARLPGLRYRPGTTAIVVALLDPGNLRGRIWLVTSERRPSTP
jgi:hypothetical protein